MVGLWGGYECLGVFLGPELGKGNGASLVGKPRFLLPWIRRQGVLIETIVEVDRAVQVVPAPIVPEPAPEGVEVPETDEDGHEHHL